MEIPKLQDRKDVKKWLVAVTTSSLAGARMHGAIEIKLEVKFDDGEEWHDICRVYSPAKK